mmetsp:Transcript_19869/g.47723  ORF Transcript_19869/g.47723 Transcript_19869/m.47723 type:complete len:172 (-) Transcript_19869:451-966(-)
MADDQSNSDSEDNCASPPSIPIGSNDGGGPSENPSTYKSSLEVEVEVTESPTTTPQPQPPPPPHPTTNWSTWRSSTKKTTAQNYEYWSLKDLWMNYHEVDDGARRQILHPIMMCCTIILAAVLVVCSMTYVAYRISGSSMLVNPPCCGGGSLVISKLGMVIIRIQVVMAER